MKAAIAVAFVGYLEVFFPILGYHNVLAIGTGMSAIWFFSWVNSKTINSVALVQLLTTVLKIAPIFFVGIFGIFYIQSDYFSPINLSGESNWSAISATTSLTLFAFLGIESATIPSRRIKNAATTIDRATKTGVFLTIIIYILSSVAVMGIIPPAVLATSTAPFADAAALFWGEAAKYIVAGGAVISTLGALNGWILIQGQIPMAAAQDQLFPKIFGKVNSRNAPIIGIALSSMLASVLMSLNYSKTLVDAFTFMMKLSTLSVLTPYLLSTLSFVLLLRRQQGKVSTTKLALAILTASFCIWFIIGCGVETITWGLALLAIGVPFYVYGAAKVWNK